MASMLIKLYSGNLSRRLGKIYREKMMNEEFVYISDPKDVGILVRNEGEAPIRPHLEPIVQARHQEGLPVGITSHQGLFCLLF